MRRVLLLLTLLASSPASALELVGSVGVEGRTFFDPPLDDAQHGANISLLVQPELFHDWDRGYQLVTFTPYLRLDAGDDERTHWDIREAYYLKAARSWELTVGIRQVFWGVAESQHLIDVINQTDLVENQDGEDRLGQPMVWLKLLPDPGTLDLFVLPGFRERTFPGREGRPRFGPVVDTGAARYESDAEDAHVDFAARWSQVIGPMDIGIGHFHGTSREPRFVAEGAGEEFRLVPLYEQIDQTSLDAQATLGGWLWKVEALRRQGQGQTFSAAVGGFEYTLVGIGGKVWDLGVLAEYHFDDRGEDAPTPFESDVFLGGRLVLNDVSSTTLLAGAFLDLNGEAVVGSVEASRRIGDRYTASLEIRNGMGTAPGDPFHAFRRDGYLQLELSRYF